MANETNSPDREVDERDAETAGGPAGRPHGQNVGENDGAAGGADGRIVQTDVGENQQDNSVVGESVFGGADERNSGTGGGSNADAAGVGVDATYSYPQTADKAEKSDGQ